MLRGWYLNGKRILLDLTIIMHKDQEGSSLCIMIRLKAPSPTATSTEAPFLENCRLIANDNTQASLAKWKTSL